MSPSLQEFLYTDPALALEYYMLAAEALGGSVQARHKSLTAPCYFDKE